MAFEVTQQEILKQAIELKQLYETTRIQKYKDEELRLRRIVVELQSISLAAGVTSFNTRTGAVVLTAADVNSALGYTASDMLKSVYDTDNDGIVDNAEGISVVGRNSTGSTLYRGTIVYISGSTGNRPNFVKAQANVEATSAGTFGVVRDDIANNSDGYVTTIGVLNNLDTRSTATHPFTDVTLADGDTVYLHPTIAGYITNVKPSAPNHLVYVGKVTRTHPTLGTIVYRIQNGYELEELHNVAISSVANKDLLYYDNASSLWKNGTFATIFGGTPLVSVPTLDQVTTAGNTTTNGIALGYTSFTNMMYGEVPKLYVNGGTYLNGNVQLGTSNIRVSGNNISWESTGIANNLPEWRADATGIKFGNYLSLPLRISINGVENARFFSTGNVGINTTTDAGYKLDVNGTARVKSLAEIIRVESTSTIGNSYIQFINASGNLGYIGWGSSITNNLNIYNEKNADVIIGSNNIERLRILSGGNIGIGTGTSSSAFSGSAKVLSIVDNTTSNVSSFRAYGGGTITSIELFGGVSYVGLYGSTNHPMTFWTNATEQMRIFTTGNVGIGTSTDAGYKLDVNGTGRFTGSLKISNDMTIDSTGDRSITWAVNDLRLISGTTNIVRFYTGESRFYKMVSLAPSQSATSVVGQAMAYFNADGTAYITSLVSNPYVNHLSTKFLIYGADGAYGGMATQGVSIYIYPGVNTTNTSYGNIILGHDGTILRGNVLVGTSTDGGYKLDVNGTARVQSDLTIGQLGGSGTINFPNTISGFTTKIYTQYASNNLIIQSGQSSINVVGSGQIQLAGSTTITAYNGSAALIVQQGNAAWSPVADFNGSSGTALRVNTNGNILIGTTTDAGYKLDVNGTSIHRGNTQIVSGRLNVGLDASSAIPSILTNLQVMTPGSMGVYPTLGTAGGGLFVAGDITNYGFFIGVNNSSGDTWMQAMRTDAAQAYHIVMQTAGGNVGIGSSGTPSYKLNVTGEINATVAYRINGTQGFTGTYTVATNPVGQRNLNISGGIITSIS